MKKFKYLGETVKEVKMTVPVTVYQWNGFTFASAKAAKQAISKCKSNLCAIDYGYLYLTDPFEDLEKYGELHGIKL